MRRFYIEPVADAQNKVVLGPEESRHCVRVLRLAKGDAVELFDGTGVIYQGFITAVSRLVEIQITGSIVSQVGTAPPLWVCQGDLKGGKMDDLVQRCTELGVERFLPFSCDRSQGRNDCDRLARKRERWRGIVRAACKQSGRVRVMDVDAPWLFHELIAQLPDRPGCARVLCWEEERDEDLNRFDWPALKSVCLMIGPEGGFASDEVALARQHGWLTVGLGPIILRAETATIAAVSIIQHRLGNLA